MNQSDTPALRFVDSLFRHRWLFAVAVIAVASVTTLAVTLPHRTWEATAQTRVSTQDITAQLGDQSQAPDSTYSNDTPAMVNVNRLSDLLKDNVTGGFIDSALRRADLNRPIDVDPRARDPRLALLNKNLSISASSDTMFDIALTWDDPRECERIVAAIRQQYIAELGQERSAQSTVSADLLDSQIADYRARMQRAETGLIEFKQQNAAHLPEEQTARITQLGVLEARRDSLLITQKDAALQVDGLDQHLRNVSPYVVDQTVGQSPMTAQLLQLKAQRDTLLAKYKPNHPAVLALDDQIKNLEQDLGQKSKTHAPEAMTIVSIDRRDSASYSTLQQELTEARINLTTQQSQLAAVNSLIDQYQADARSMPTEQRRMADLTQDYTILTDRYQELLKKRQDVEMQGDIDRVSASATLTPIGAIYAAPSMTHSKAAAIVAGGVVLGLVVATLALILNEWGDRSLRYPADAQRLIGVPVLASVPETGALNRLSDPEAGAPPVRMRLAPPQRSSSTISSRQGDSAPARGSDKTAREGKDSEQ